MLKMYIPKPFRVEDLPQIHAMMRQYSFAMLVSEGPQQDAREHGPMVTHLPLLLSTEETPFGTLAGHMARVNPHWQTAADRTALAVFSGPHAHISAAWYGEKNVVPTWNYITVHAYGTLRIMEDPRQLRELLQRTVEQYETAEDSAWSLGSTDRDFLQRMTESIVGFTISIERLEGCWKLNQHHSESRRQGAIAGLRKRNQPGDREIADSMENPACSRHRPGEPDASASGYSGRSKPAS